VDPYREVSLYGCLQVSFLQPDMSRVIDSPILEQIDTLLFFAGFHMFGFFLCILITMNMLKVCSDWLRTFISEDKIFFLYSLSTSNATAMKQRI
jgi:hypothetical protein